MEGTSNYSIHNITSPEKGGEASVGRTALGCGVGAFTTGSLVEAQCTTYASHEADVRLAAATLKIINE